MNIAKILKQAQLMQKQMKQVQENLAQEQINVSVGGGKISVSATANGQINKIKISPELCISEEVEFLEDLLLQAVQKALNEANEKAKGKMSDLSGGIDMPEIDSLGL